MSLTLTYIRWKDACYRDATFSLEAPKAELSDLSEIGFLLDETDEAVLIGMEHSNDDSDHGRGHLNIPKINIVERKDIPFDSVFGTKKVRKPRVKKAVSEVKP